MKNITLALLVGTLILNAQVFDVKKGWSLVGATDKIENLSLFSEGCMGSVYSYGEKQWHTYPDGDLKKMNVGEGFWIYATKDCSVDTSKVVSTFDAKSFFLGNCATCHGDSGQGASSRAIKGQTKSWYSSKLTPFQKGDRTSPSVMSGLLKGFDVNNLDKLNTFLATLGK